MYKVKLFMNILPHKKIKFEWNWFVEMYHYITCSPMDPVNGCRQKEGSNFW